MLTKSAATARRLLWDERQRGFVAGAEATVSHKTLPFLKGPVPLDWICAACGLPGKALNAALCLRYLQGLTRSDTVTAGNRVRGRFGLSRQAWYDALKRLEQAGLVRLERKQGRSARITLIDVTQAASR